MSTQPEPSVAATPSSRSRSRSRSRIVANAEMLVDSEVKETATIDVPELLQTPQIAPGNEHHRFPSALNEQETRQFMRRQSLRMWWHMRGRKINSGGLDFRLLKAWMKLGFPASPTASIDGIPLASPEHNVVVDPVKEMALWDKWGREAWLIIVASEEDWIVDNGYTFEVSQAQFAFDLSLFAVPSSPFVNVFPL